MLICWAVLGGFVLDAIFGDPAWLPHPVVLMGKEFAATSVTALDFIQNQYGIVFGTGFTQGLHKLIGR